ncbi:hypothetical protein ABZ371_02645 [Streptomyces sp. NPDC005899]|uniref:hypothetical protein n=1 Tax=Streptomyces sp. NPDC005899 TaxID=3155716 RepID=UPI0033CE7C17
MLVLLRRSGQGGVLPAVFEEIEGGVESRGGVGVVACDAGCFEGEAGEGGAGWVVGGKAALLGDDLGQGAVFSSQV